MRDRQCAFAVYCMIPQVLCSFFKYAYFTLSVCQTCLLNHKTAWIKKKQQQKTTLTSCIQRSCFLTTALVFQLTACLFCVNNWCLLSQTRKLMVYNRYIGLQRGSPALLLCHRRFSKFIYNSTTIPKSNWELSQKPLLLLH